MENSSNVPPGFGGSSDSQTEPTVPENEVVTAAPVSSANKEDFDVMAIFQAAFEEMKVLWKDLVKVQLVTMAAILVLMLVGFLLAFFGMIGAKNG